MRGRRRKENENEMRLEGNELTNDGEIDATVASRRSFEIDSASVESGVRFAYVVNHQSSRVFHCAKISSFAEDVLVGPMSWPIGVLVSSVVPVIYQSNHRPNITID